MFQDRKLSQEEKIPDLVLDIQFEILKLLSEKDDLTKENEVLKHYRLSCMKLQKENSQLRERLELLQVVPSFNKDPDCCLDFPGLSRTSPDGQAEAEQSEENVYVTNCDQVFNGKSLK